MARISLLVCAGAVASLATATSQSSSVVTFSADGAAAAQASAEVDRLIHTGTLDLAGAQPDPLIEGRSFERLAQVHDGVPVIGGYVVRQMEGRNPVAVIGRVYQGISVAADADVSADAATASALAAHGGPDAARVHRAPVLQVRPMGDGTYALAYRVAVSTGFDLRVCYVDATTGALLLDYSNLQSQAAVGLGTGVFGDQKKVSANRAGATFRSEDRLRPTVTSTADFRGDLARLLAFLSDFTVSLSDVATDSDNVWTDGAVVDAHAHMGYTYDYLFKRFGRRGLDDRNLPVNGVVHPLLRSEASRFSPETRNTLINNALYFGDGLLLFGDGDGVTFDYLAGALDVVAHEMTHGVTEFTSALEYADEPGALNEAFSDIIGTAVEFFYQQPGAGTRRADWLIAEDVARFPPGYLRSMESPALVGHPDHYSLRFTGTADNGGVHINSSIVNHAFYLAVAGGTNRISRLSVVGIGLHNIDRMEKIFYRAFAFMLGPLSNFRDARAATLQSAADLFGPGSAERTQLQQAWDAVGVQ